MATQRYILRIEDGELFPWYEPWLKNPGMVEYEPAKHGYRAEVAAAMGLEAPGAPASETPKPRAGKTASNPPVAAESKKTQAQPSEPDLSDVFGKK